LIQAAAEAGADVLRGVPLPPDQVELRRRNAHELNLGQYLHTGYHGPRWTPAEVALLGTLPDEELAAQIGKTPVAVSLKRRRLGIANPCDRRRRPGAAGRRAASATTSCWRRSPAEAWASSTRHGSFHRQGWWR
jgi:hypothetical protein